MTSTFTTSLPSEFGTHEQVPTRFLDDAGTPWWMDRLEKRHGLSVVTIGLSRGGRPLYGLRIGSGGLKCTVTAGAHADEPAGPMAACLLAWHLTSDTAAARRLLNAHTFYICPQVNPDASEANKAWFAPVPDVRNYLTNVQRELPGDDIEFGYPGGGKRALRPENAAVAGFLRHAGPVNLHVSLHSMAMAEGAWILIENGWATRSRQLQEQMAATANAAGFKLHDIQRDGDKGFTRIARGFCTTPTSTAMRQHFLAAGDPEMAAKFHLSSMEYACSLGNDPFCMVTEIPAFAINGGWQAKPVEPEDLDGPAPEPGATAYEKCRKELAENMASGDIEGAVETAARYGATPIPFAIHSGLQVELMLKALDALQEKPQQ